MTATRSSPDCAIGQPIRAPISAASAIARSMKSRTSGSSRIRSVVAPVSAEIGFDRHVAPELVPDVPADVGARLGAEAGLASALQTAVVRAESPPAGSPTIRRLPKPCWTTPGAGLEQARWTTQPRTARAAAPRRCGRRDRRSSSGAAGAAPPGVCPVWRNHHGTPFIAGSTIVSGPISGARRAAASISAGALKAMTTRSCGPSASRRRRLAPARSSSSPSMRRAGRRPGPRRASRRAPAPRPRSRRGPGARRSDHRPHPAPRQRSS